MSRTALPFRRFTANAWELLTDWARDITQRINEETPTEGLADACVTPAKLAETPACLVYRNTAQSIASGGAATTLIAMSNIEYVTGGVDAPIVTDQMRIRVMRDGIYVIAGQLGYDVTVAPATSMVFGTLNVDGVQVAQASQPSILTTAPVFHFHRRMRLVVGQLVDMRAYQTNGIAQNTQSAASTRPMLSVEYVGAA